MARAQEVLDLQQGSVSVAEEFERIAMDLGEAQEANEKNRSGETKRDEADALDAWIEFSEEYTDRATAALTGKGSGGDDEESGGVEADGGEEE